MSIESALKILSSILKKDQILTDVESRNHYGRDWTTYYDINASAVVFPQSLEDVVEIVNWARTHKVPLVPSGGRTGLSGSAVATSGEVIVTFEKMNKIIDFDPLNSTVKLQGGVITETLQEFAKSKGLFYPVDFAARGSSQIAGNIATNAGGIKVIKYGLTRDWVTALTVVTGSGEVLHLNNSLVKNATGLDFRHLFIGSEGILGFIVEATIKLAPPPKDLKVFLMGLAGLNDVMNVFAKFREVGTLVAFELFSQKALDHVLASTQLAKPLDQDCPFYVVAELDVLHESILEKSMETFSYCLEQGWVLDGALSQSESQAKEFWRYREQISESLAKYSPYKNDVSVTISDVPAFMEDLDQVLKQKYPDWEVIWFGHIGDGNLHINILRPSGMSKEDFVKECRQVDPLIFSTVQKYAGSISAEHGVGLSKKSFLGFTRSEAEIQLMRQIKKIFDPDGIINPGKVI